MRILIVGASSSLAQALIPILSQFAQVFRAGRADGDIHLDLGDELDPRQLPPGIDVLVNAAASFGGTDPSAVYVTEQVNALGTLKLCQLCTAASIPHMLQVSSIFASLDAASPFYTAYSLSKRHADELAQLYCKNAGLALTIIKPSQFYGVGQAYRQHQPFLFSIIDKVANNEDVAIYGRRDARRNFIHVEDVAHLIALAIQRRLTGSYACAHPQDVSYSDIFRAAALAFHSSSQLHFVPQQPDIADNVFPADDRLFRLLGYTPRISFAAGMAREAAHRKGKQ